jgi:hypothetical protein
LSSDRGSATADVQSPVEFAIEFLLLGIEYRHRLLFSLLRRRLRRKWPRTRLQMADWRLMVAAMVVFSGTCFTASPGAAKAGPVTPPGHYCLSYDEGGTDCSFITSYAQCEVTAFGIDAEC